MNKISPVAVLAECLLAPRSIAFVGVSAKGGAGTEMLRSTIRSGFDGSIWPISAKVDTIEGLPCIPSLAALPQTPDCVVISIPADGVISVVEEAAALGIRAALVVSEGFADDGTEEGRQRQDRLVAIAKASGMALAGPNCMGVVTLVKGFAATLADVPAALPSGGMSLVSQSGGLLNAVAELAANRGIGMNYLISIGNQAVLDLADYIDFLADDPGTRVIACAMEGAKDGRRFRAAIERATRKKPVVILKLGRSELGQAATLAHTGTLAGQHEAYEALFRRHGVASVLSLDELVETAALLSAAPLPNGNGVCVLTVSGGGTSLVSDLGEQAGVVFPPIGTETNRRLEEALHIERSFNNPVDTVGLGRLRREGALQGVIAALLDDPAIDVIGLVLGMRLEGNSMHNEILDQIAEIAAKASKPIIVLSFISNSLTRYWRDFTATRGLPLLEDLEGGLRAVRHLTDYAAFRRNVAEAGAVVPAGSSSDGNMTVGATLSEAASKRILAAAGLPVTLEFLAATPAEATTLATRIGGPVALKVQSPDIPHKSDIGGVHLRATAADAEAASMRILDNARRACPAALIEGVLVQEMVEEGAEFILGMTYDPQFGPLVVLGGGGVMVEVFKDACVQPAPVTLAVAESMIDSLKSSVLLDGFRGAPVRDRAALAACIVQFSEFAMATDGQFMAIDLNPVFVRQNGKGVKIADALIIKSSHQEELKNDEVDLSKIYG